ncbi:kinase domain protein [Xylaria intraflava]|nr:kinase domain protein [Xylaria intraflava]
MSFISRAWSRLGHQALLRPRTFANPNFIRIPPHEKVEEETLPDYLSARYYPVRIGEVFVDRYQVVGKLGFGASSTVWLAHDLRYFEPCVPAIRRTNPYSEYSQHRHVALKVFIRSQALGDCVENEIAMFKRMEQRASSHPGRSAVRTLLDSFRVHGPEGEHLVLAHPPLWQSVEGAIRRSSPRRLPASGLRFVLKDIFLALEYLHDECQIIHTDIKADNIMFGITDFSVFNDFEEQEMNDPCPRKELEGRIIYTSRKIKSPGQIGPPVLCDFGSAVFGGGENLECVQPNVYRAPEVILRAPWDHKIDIWNVGCMAWDLYEGNQLFHGIDPEHQAYRRRAHLAEIIALLGLPPKDLLARGRLARKFFSDEGEFAAGIELPAPKSLEGMEEHLTGDEKRRFLTFMQKMLQWAPEQRSTAGELFQDAWLQEQA